MTERPIFSDEDADRAEAAVQAAVGGKAFRIMGSLLGEVRDGGRTPHDHDVDLGILAENFTEDMIEPLKEAGWKIVAAARWRQAWMLRYVGRDVGRQLNHVALLPPWAESNHNHVDLNIYFPGVNGWEDYRFMTNGWARGVTLERVPDEQLRGDDPIPLLEWWYGEDWRTPVFPWYGSRARAEALKRTTCRGASRWRLTGDEDARDARRRARSGRPPLRKRAKPEPPEEIDPNRLAILVPFRDSLDGVRGPAWEWLQKRWAATIPEALIVVGEDSGGEPFSKTTAVNDAFLKTPPERDILVGADADAWMDRDDILRAAAYAADRGTLVIPWGRVIRLASDDGAVLMAKDPATPFEANRRVIQKAFHSPPPQTAGTIWVISREGFEKVNGMDERFRGWGYEDVAFGKSCRAILGAHVMLKGYAFTLYHPRPRLEGRRAWDNEVPGNQNLPLGLRYVKAAHNKRMMAALCAEHPIGEPAKPYNPEPTRRDRSRLAREKAKVGKNIIRI